MPVIEPPDFTPAPEAPVESPATNRRVRPLMGGQAWLHEFEAGGAAWQVVVLDARHNTLRVVDQPDSWGGGGAIDEVLDASGAIAGVNGGFFSTNFKPLGLMIANGRRKGAWQANKLLTGSLVVSQGTPCLVWNAEGRRESGASDFLQAGPRLVDARRPMTSLDRTKNAARSFIATNGGHLWAIGVVRSTSLAELGRMLAMRGLMPGFAVNRALNLDGGRSSAIHARLSDGNTITEPGWSTVRNYVAVVPLR
jgi:exopolysaccharide biosynthesis protein